MNTLQQEFAQKAYLKVAAYGKEHEKGSKQRQQYGSMAHRLPVLVHTAGLVQALAYVAQSKRDPHRELLDHLAEVLDNSMDTKALLEKSRTEAFEEYRFLTRQALLALTWFKRFAQSVLEVDPGSEED